VPDPAGPPGPYAQYRTEVRGEWIDYNGHLHDAGYATVLSEANEALLAHLGLSEAYRVATGRAMYTVESHIRYLAEARQGDVIEAASLLVSADAKRMRVHTLLRRGEGDGQAGHEDDRGHHGHRGRQTEIDGDAACLAHRQLDLQPCEARHAFRDRDRGTRRRPHRQPEDVGRQRFARHRLTRGLGVRGATLGGGVLDHRVHLAAE